MDSVRRIFFIFFALLVPLALASNPRQPFLNTARPAVFTVFEENGKVGLKNDQGEIVIPAQYEAIGWSNGQFSLVGNVTGYKSKGLWGLINTQNSKVTKAEYDDLSPSQGEIIVARKKIPGTITVRSGCINLSGKQIIPFAYDGIRISSFRAIVYQRIGNQFRHGLIDLQNSVLIPLSFQNIYPLGSLRFGVENFDNKTAIYSEDGKQLTNFLIDSLSTFHKDYAILYQNQRQGLISRNGEIKLEPIYNAIRFTDRGSIETKMANTWLVLDGQNNLLRQTNADSIIVIAKNVLKITSGANARLTDMNFDAGKNNWYAAIGKFIQNKAPFTDGNRFGLMDKMGRVLVKPLYASLTVVGGGIIAQLPADKRYILIDSVGATRSMRSYEAIEVRNEKFLAAKNRGYWGAIDSNGKEIIGCTHDSIGEAMGRMAVVKFKGKYGVVDFDERWVVTPQVGKIRLVNSERYLIQSQKTKFLKSFKGEIIYFSDNKLELKEGYLIESLQSGSYLKIDMNGLIADRFDRPESIQELYEEKEGLRAIKKDDRYGFVDNRGRLRIANRYESVKSFSENFAAVKIRGRWGFINREDEIAVQPNYDQVEPFRNGFCVVRQKDFYGLIDKSGKVVLPLRYEAIEILPDKKIKVKQNGQWGISESSGKIVLHPKFETLIALSNGYMIVSRQNKFGVVNAEGMSTIPEVYDGITYDAVHNAFMAVRTSEWQTVQPD